MDVTSAAYLHMVIRKLGRAIPVEFLDALQPLLPRTNLDIGAQCDEFATDPIKLPHRSVFV